MGFIPEQQINDLKDRIDIVDLISEYVNLKRAGSSFKGLCPFHNEKTPSFMVNREKNNFHCFGCHEGGDAISFIMKIENLGYIDAIKFIADKLGVVLEETEYSKDRVNRNNKYYEINSLAAKFYFKNLLTYDFPQEYLAKRGLDKKVLNKYFLGYARNDNSLYAFLKENGFEEKDMLDLGLIGESNDRYYDKFRDRLMFPILNNKNKVIGFGGRTLIDHKIKYINSPESDIFIKGKNIYGVNVVNRNRRNKVILVEGYMDVIALYNKGIDYALATLGTALTEDQARMIKRYSNEIFIAYDGDTAGVKATLRAIDIFKNMDVHLGILEFPDDMDPDEYIKKYGKEAFEKLMDKATTPIDFKLNKLMESTNNKIEFINEIIMFLSTIQGNVIRDLYIDKSAKFIGVTTDSLRIDVNKEIEKNKSKEKYKTNIKRQSNGYISNKVAPKKVNYIDNHRIKLEKEIIIYSLLNKENFEKLSSESDFIEDAALKEIYSKITDMYLNQSLVESVTSLDVFKSLNLEKDYEAAKNSESSLDGVLEELKERVEKFRLKSRIREIKEELKTKKNDKSLISEYTSLLQRLT
ncbi:DNA primase [Helcococcus kunzii ATCC 51366]|uniref:DNA primase n=1 Tax=Helcococcus kunzii ATCC 51366 TaxID=883114 RepID=H3NPX5_9FIRM|nr:DNA primase [Helcococcus kunzii]EHR33197.1 DNA primase [Helcococcus kunzii ATCC 51366]